MKRFRVLTAAKNPQSAIANLPAGRQVCNIPVFQKKLPGRQPFIVISGFPSYKHLKEYLSLTDLVTIIRGCAENNARSQKMIYDRYLGFALKTAFRYVHSYDNAAHAANDAFIKIFKAFKTFEIRDMNNVEPMLMGWMKRIVINTSIDFMLRESLVPEHITIPDDAWNKKDTGAGGEHNLVYKELISLVRKLSPAYRVVFNLHVIDGYTHPEIAKMLGISVGTSKSNLAKAKSFLQKYLVKDNNGNVLCFT
jgi:RNA polymerase sigma-70 factor (ECF subfamily)